MLSILVVTDLKALRNLTGLISVKLIIPSLEDIIKK